MFSLNNSMRPLLSLGIYNECPTDDETPLKMKERVFFFGSQSTQKCFDIIQITPEEVLGTQPVFQANQECCAQEELLPRHPLFSDNFFKSEESFALFEEDPFDWHSNYSTSSGTQTTQNLRKISNNPLKLTKI